MQGHQQQQPETGPPNWGVPMANYDPLGDAFLREQDDDSVPIWHDSTFHPEGGGAATATAVAGPSTYALRQPQTQSTLQGSDPSHAFAVPSGVLPTDPYALPATLPAIMDSRRNSSLASVPVQSVAPSQGECKEADTPMPVPRHEA